MGHSEWDINRVGHSKWDVDTVGHSEWDVDIVGNIDTMGHCGGHLYRGAVYGGY